MRHAAAVENASKDNSARMIIDEHGTYRERLSTSEIDGVPVVELPINEGSTVAVWEVIRAGGQAEETFDFAVYISYVPSPGRNLPSPGTATVNGSFAPSPPFIEAALSSISVWYGQCLLIVCITGLLDAPG